MKGAPMEENVAEILRCIDGDHTPENRARIEKAIAADPGLKKIVDEAARQVELLRKYESDLGLVDGVAEEAAREAVARVSAARPEKSYRLVWALPAAVAAAAAVVLAAANLPALRSWSGLPATQAMKAAGSVTAAAVGAVLAVFGAGLSRFDSWVVGLVSGRPMTPSRAEAWVVKLAGCAFVGAAAALYWLG